MGNRAIWKAVWHISFTEFQRWLRSSRLIVLGVMLVFIHIQIIVPLQECAAMMQEPVSVGEAFVALGNSGFILLIVPVLFLTLMADFPQKSGIDYFYQIRCPKKVWICGQMLFALEASVFVVAFLAVSCGVMMGDRGQWSMEFSHAVTHYLAAFPDRRGDYVVQLVPENVYHQMTLGAAILHTAVFMFLHFLLLALILLLSALCNQKYVGILANGFLIIFGGITCALRLPSMWLFPLAHTVPRLHYEAYLKKVNFPIHGSYLSLLCGCAVLAVCCMASSGFYQAGKD